MSRHQAIRADLVTGIERCNQVKMLLDVAAVPARPPMQAQDKRTAPDQLGDVTQEEGTARHLGEQHMELGGEADIVGPMVAKRLILLCHCLVQSRDVVPQKGSAQSPRDDAFQINPDGKEIVGLFERR